MTAVACPHCSSTIDDADRFCWSCKRYVAEPGRHPEPDTRSEALIRTAIKLRFLAAGCTIADTEQNRKTRVTPGLSDLIVFGPGWLAFVEVKTPTGIQTVPQERFEGWVTKAGGVYTIMRHESEVDTFLASMRERGAA